MTIELLIGIIILVLGVILSMVSLIIDFYKK